MNRVSMSFLSRAKDRIVEQVALAYLNNTLLLPYGRATTVHFDSTAKTITLIAELRGETVPVKIEITDYEISQDGSHYYAKVKGVRTSREWLTALGAIKLSV